MMHRPRPVAVFALHAAVAAQQFFSPAAAATSLGNLPNYSLFGRRMLQYQQIHDASSFTPALAGPIVLMRGRANTPTSAGTADVELFLAPNLKPAGAIDIFFAMNESAAARVNVVMRKVVNLQAVGAGVWGAPVLVFDVPYLAPPSQGLCWRIVIYSSSVPLYPVDSMDGNTGTPISSYPGCQHPFATQPAFHYSIARAPSFGFWFSIGTSFVTTRALSAFLLVGASASLWGGTLPLPYDLTTLGAPGCQLVVDPALVAAGTTVPMASGRVQFLVAPIGDPTLVGQTLYTQVAFVDAAANALGVFTTGGLASRIPAARGVGYVSSATPTASYADAGRNPDTGIVIALN